MKTSMVGALLLCISMCISAYAVTDSTSFDPTAVAVEAKGAGGVPVGTIVAWPVEQNPADWDMWLECNGQTIDPAVYPELFAIVGAKAPDLRGIFLRGNGGNSNLLGKYKLMPFDFPIYAGYLSSVIELNSSLICFATPS